MVSGVHGVEVSGRVTDAVRTVLPDDAQRFLASLQREFGERRRFLLARRVKRQEEIRGGRLPDFPPETLSVRDTHWRVAETPKDLLDRRVEITGPCERKMMINALNSGAKVFMADLEDALSPTWTNVIEGQLCLSEAVRGTLSFNSPEGKSYRLGETLATLLVRPRGWHLEEQHVRVDGAAMSASLFDFGLYVFHNARERLDRGTAPYFYIPKLESHLEARLWNDVFNFAQDALKIPRGSIRATMLIETILAAFEMEEILYELRDHAAGLNAGRWDYIFSCIKKFHHRKDLVLPDRAQVTMTVPFMRAYTEMLVKTCHRRGAHAIGGMAAFIPSRRDPQVNEIALGKVRDDKLRESRDGFDGTWVAHPDLVPVAQAVFDQALGAHAHQKDRMRDEVNFAAKDLLDLRVPGGQVSEAGVRSNLSVGLQYIDSWLNGVGAAAIFNLMEDAATAEISRAQLWQWLHHRVTLDDGRTMSPELYKQMRDEELGRLGGIERSRLRDAAEILDKLVLDSRFGEFLTIPAYGYLDREKSS